MNTSNIQEHHMLSAALRSASRFANSPASAGFLRECSMRALELEQQPVDPYYDDVKAFHEKFGHPAPASVVRELDDEMLEFRIARIDEEADELVDAIRSRNLAKIAAEAVDLIYVVIGTLVALGLPLIPFWRDVQRANMTKVPAGPLAKPIKPEGWVRPNPAQVLYEYKTSFMEDPDGPEMG
mgnify:CR=1 FL=1|tara:strand:- start:11946 stop:12491 length:546 start_codon:yes stop_codon:yes gene_type:complete